jgi:hypothetical protein
MKADLDWMKHESKEHAICSIFGFEKSTRQSGITFTYHLSLLYYTILIHLFISTYVMYVHINMYRYCGTENRVYVL